jgi:hypothetical protein
MFYDYTVELAPLPASGEIPVAPKDFDRVFPKLSPPVAESLKKQLAVASLKETKWLTFRTLRRTYDKQLRFATGSCRWYPGDKENGKDFGPDMLHGLGDWLRLNPKEKWPHFLFFGGDQIYSDEIGDDHGEMLINGRFAARVPGPADPAVSLRDKLIDGAWAGRFAHRYRTYKDPDIKLVERVRGNLKKLDEIHRRYPDIKGIYREYPEADPREKLKWRYQTLKTKRELGGAKGEESDERKAREAVNLLPTVDALEITDEPFRAHLPHWTTGFGIPLRRNPMGYRYLSHNFLLWSIPDFEDQLPTVADQHGPIVARRPDRRGHPAAAGGRHAADFAEYAYLYERAWTSSRSVRVLLGQIPTFLMFDDHEVTDDWNFDVSWVRMLHNEKDDFQMWPKTLTDSLAAYWVYQGWGNKAPSQWKSGDPRIKALDDARQQGTDALPKLRECIHRACFMPAPRKDANAAYQAGLSLDWHYKLPFNPPFLVPDCRSRKRMVPADDNVRNINHDDPSKAPKSQTIDDNQLAWMRKILVEEWRGGPVAFIAPSTPLLLQKKVMSFMRDPEVAAKGWAGSIDLASIGAALLDSTKLGIAKDKLLRVFRRAKDLEHMIRDRSWRDLWGLAEEMRKKGSPVKTLVLVSGDVHHSYNMTANLPGSGRPRPELVQITSSGLQTTIRKDFKTSLAEELSSLVFDVGRYRLVPGFVSKNDIGNPDLVLYENAVALVDVTMGLEVGLVVAGLAGKEKHIYRYTSGAAYLEGGEPTVLVNYRRKLARGQREVQHDLEERDELRDLEPAAPRREAQRISLDSPFMSNELFAEANAFLPSRYFSKATSASPFLSGKLFTGQAALEESAGLAALQTEGAFQPEFEAVEEGSISTVAPEAYEDETEAAGETDEIFPELEEQILVLPSGLPGLPNDATLRGQLQAMGTAEARALDATFAAIGDPAKFSVRLPPALNATFESLSGGPRQKFRIYVARLGAEAFILNTPLEPASRYDNFVDHPDRLGNALTGADRQNFVHFAMRRLHQISPIVVKPPTHRRQMSRAAAMFRLFQSELARFAPLFVDNTFSLAYRTLAVQIIWRHYQALQDGVLEAAARSRLNWALMNKEWEKDLETAAVTNLLDDGSALAPTFRLTPILYRDYFNPTAASDIGFQYYTATPTPVTGHGPEMPYRIVFRRRAEQKAFIERLRKERETDPLPKLHDTNSWQMWVRETWDSPLLRRETKLEVILKYVSGYFEVFTIHTPHDLREGCSVANYLIRPFPRAITGSLVHDCFVYAVRWLHILGRLLSPGSTPAGIANPHIFLVEMPAHVGAMIRADMPLNRHVVVSINNKHAEIHELDAGKSDEAAAQTVVQDMYRGMRTPYVVRPLASKPADAKALWNEVCKLSEKKLTLPYLDPKFPPHLRYLEHNAMVARISRELSDAVRVSWVALHERLAAAKDGSGKAPPAGISAEIRQHGANFEKALQAANARLDQERVPLIENIDLDVTTNEQRILKSKGVRIVETNASLPFTSEANTYRGELEKAILSRDLSALDPADFFPEDDFVAAVE